MTRQATNQAADQTRGPVEHVDVVVVGSGFGGSVSAYRMAEAGKSVVVLERGRPYPPGSFSRSPAEFRRSFWQPDRGRYGLFEAWSFRGFDSVVSAGLGGGSLIYANVLLRKDEHWFVRDEPLPGGGYESWPVTRADLDPHYDAVERMLTPSPYPLGQPGYDDVPKTTAMRDAADALGLDWGLPPLAVRFAARPGGEPRIGLAIEDPPYGNLHGVPRRTCRLCGECDVGCNDGAKNSLDHTYLSAAVYHGADIRTLCEVRALRPDAAGGYRVRYARHQPDGSATLHTIAADRVILAAGTFGTSRLLLGNRAHLPGLSDALGTRFSGNGDVLAFLVGARTADGPRALDASRGPVITSSIRVPDELDGTGAQGRGFYLQDGGYPGFVDWLVQGLDVPGDLSRLAGFALHRLGTLATGRWGDRLSDDLAELLADETLSVSSLPLLGMGRDVPDGVMRLRDGELDVEWSTATSRAYFDRVRETMRRLSEWLGGEYVDNPMWLRRRIVSSHPLGGAPMGRHPGEGVCDPYGEVFGHPGLYVADGAAMPGPVGANPSLTIAACANRMCDELLERGVSGRAPALASRRGIGEPAPAEEAVPAGLGGAAGTATFSFTEVMHGTLRLHGDAPDAADAVDRDDPDTGSAVGEAAGDDAGERSAPAVPLSFRLTVTIDLDRFLAEPEHRARAEGWVDCPAWGGRLPVDDATVALLVADEPGRGRQMVYHLPFADDTGRKLVLTGVKELRPGPPTDIWPDTTTLHVRVLAPTDADEADDPPPVGSGVLRLTPWDFLRQLTTVRATGPDPLRTFERFGAFFVRQLWGVYWPGTRREEHR